MVISMDTELLSLTMEINTQEILDKEKSMDTVHTSMLKVMYIKEIMLKINVRIRIAKFIFIVEDIIKEESKIIVTTEEEV